jgi:hypothetical protein
MFCPPTEMVPVREAVVVFAPAFTVIEAPPLPVAGEAVSHWAFDVAFHAHPARVLIPTVAAPPSAAIVKEVGDAV